MIKTSITQVTVANPRIIKEVAALTKTDPKIVAKMAKFIGLYIAATIEKGQMEAVMIPYFGKFKPKDNYNIERQIIAKERSGQDLVYRAIKGKRVVDLREKKAYDAPKKVRPPKRIK